MRKQWIFTRAGNERIRKRRRRDVRTRLLFAVLRDEIHVEMPCGGSTNRREIEGDAVPVGGVLPVDLHPQLVDRRANRVAFVHGHIGCVDGMPAWRDDRVTPSDGMGTLHHHYDCRFVMVRLANETASLLHLPTRMPEV